MFHKNKNMTPEIRKSCFKLFTIVVLPFYNRFYSKKIDSKSIKTAKNNRQNTSLHTKSWVCTWKSEFAHKSANFAQAKNRSFVDSTNKYFA